ncbi:MAG: DUF1822 family protein [Phormidium sp.]
MNWMTEQLTFSIPLSFEAHSLAQKLSQVVTNKKKAKQIYLNTLAIYTVNFYLNCMGFTTDWENSDSYNPLIYKLLDIADLQVAQIGTIECRPVAPDATFCSIPPEVQEDRIAYVFVQLNHSLKSATILGFTPTVSNLDLAPRGRASILRSQVQPGNEDVGGSTSRNARFESKRVSINQLQTLEDFLEYLSQKCQPGIINLKQWFNGIFETGWNRVNQLLNPHQVDLAFTFRNAANITRGQQIDLGMQLVERSVALVITLPPKADETEVDILVQVHPMGKETCLPPGLKLIIIDESGAEVLDTESREADNFIQLQFSAESGESFSIVVSWGEASVRQNFVI